MNTTPVSNVGGIRLAAPARRRLLYRAGLTIVVVVLLLASCVGVGRCSRIQVLSSLAAIDETYTSPGGTNEIRVIITDQGALGYGGISVFCKTALGFRRVYFHAPAVADADPARVTWVSETEFEIWIEDPHSRRGRWKQRILLEF